VGGRETRQPIGQVRIDHSQRWQVRHWRTITSAYNRSPWFEYLSPSLEKIYGNHYDFLWEWNRDILSWVTGTLGIQLEINYLNRALDYGSTERADIGLNPGKAQDPGFMVSLPVYHQVFQDRIGFQPNMSVLDLLCNEGPKRALYLLRS
jgi:hypothetical protein